MVNPAAWAPPAPASLLPVQRQPEGVQRSVLGPGRFEAWKAGDYPASRWAVRRESEAWRPSYGPGPISG